MAVLTITDDNIKRVLKGISDLVKYDVMIGVPDDGAPRDDGPFTNASIAYIAENGSPVNNIPPRPFMQQGVKRVSELIAKLFKKVGDYALDGNSEAMMKTLEKIGLIGANGMKTEIQEGSFVPLAPRTIAARLRRGRTGVKPLLDTGQFRNSITYVVVKRKRR